jgi:hypothetical protein
MLRKSIWKKAKIYVSIVSSIDSRSNDGYVFVLFREWYAIYEIKEYSMLLGMEFVPRE